MRCQQHLGRSYNKLVFISIQLRDMSNKRRRAGALGTNAHDRNVPRYFISDFFLDSSSIYFYIGTRQDI